MVGMDKSSQATEDGEKSNKDTGKAPEWETSAPVVDTTVAEVPEQMCLLLGPPGSGKTSFVAALARAGMIASGDARCLPLGHATWLIQDANCALRRGDPLVVPTIGDASYSFELILGQNGSDEGESLQRLTLHEVSGLFPQTVGSEDGKVSALPEYAKSANQLILCVNVLEPRPDDWQIAMHGLLDDLATYQGVGLSPRALRFDRILMVFTRVDLLCQQVWEKAIRPARQRKAQAGNRSFVGVLDSALRRFRPRGPRELAGRLDTVAQAIDLIGEATLAMALSSMRPGAQLGLTFVSAGGFNTRTGFPFLDINGITVERSTADDLLRDWQPFGVLEAAEFVAFGRTGDSVQAIDRRVLAAQRTVSWVAAGEECLV